MCAATPVATFRRENVEDLAGDEDGPEEKMSTADEIPEEGWQETRIYADDEGNAPEDKDGDELD